jgi:hypothetical protein
MTEFIVTIQKTITMQVEVDANTTEDARAQIEADGIPDAAVLDSCQSLTVSLP